MHLTLVLLSSVATLPVLLAQLMGPYKHLEVHSLVPCPDVKAPNLTSDVKPKTEEDGSVKFYGSFNSPIEIGKNMEVEIKLYKWSSTWAKVYSFTSKDICAGLEKTAPDVADLFMKSCGKEGFVCPVEAGVHNIEGFPQILPPLKNFPKLPSGKYRIDLLIKHQGSNFGCTRIEATVCPKDKKVFPGK